MTDFPRRLDGEPPPCPPFRRRRIDRRQRRDISTGECSNNDTSDTACMQRAPEIAFEDFRPAAHVRGRVTQSASTPRMGGRFEDLAVGGRARFHEEMGEEGPQASTVTPTRAHRRP